MDVVLLIGRVLFGLLFLAFGWMHLSQRQMMTGYAASKGVPAASVLVPLTGIQIFLGALMVTIGVWPDLGGLLLAAFLIPTALLMHAFWKESDPTARATEQGQFLKDLSLAGAALVVFLYFVTAGDEAPFTVVGPLLGR